ncbi:2-hydroxyacyl-CoA dehydratase [Luteibacter pinisoli]|uniref:2-hydroxyacyl-CoA dehydratase n=1 Tax=Luteibacter pinisoli TaxID=2589080 RepID=A0A4Y5Z3C2_9GAMM|nr:2-hydroxyacyl-CoA dehydratase [Luteibacter pinisoli]QDE39617.1 2-hydroxyacyl-CoA dehydratase [Luteibacter pinisoli]
MNSSGKYDFKQFQDELAALERRQAANAPAPAAAPAPPPAPPPEKRKPGRPKVVRVDPLAEARQAFDALRISYKLSVADVVAWFPEEEGVAYLQALLAQPAPKRRRKKSDDPTAPL